MSSVAKIDALIDSVSGAQDGDEKKESDGPKISAGLLENQTSLTLTTKLSNGKVNTTKMPHFGLGTWLSKEGKVTQAVKVAVEAGYRHIDCAHVYGNEHEVGAALKDLFERGVVKREDLFITSKLWRTSMHGEDVIPAMKVTLKNLGIDYVDLYLCHWPTTLARTGGNFPKPIKNPDGSESPDYGLDDLPTHEEMWKGLQSCVDQGFAKHIGLSNFNEKQIANLIKASGDGPSVSMVHCECHPYLQQNALIKFCRENKIAFTGYSPLGSPRRPWAKEEHDPIVMEDPVLIEIAKAKGKSVAQICIRWQIQRGNVCIPKSVTPHRIVSNGEVFDFELSEKEMADIAKIDCNFRACLPGQIRDDKGVVVKVRDTVHPYWPWPFETFRFDFSMK